MKNTKEFYKNLNTIKDFSQITQENLYKKLPSDWYILVSDIKNSTVAIENGMYKQINFVASLVIIGIVNLEKNLELPFIFGGDGASVLIPKYLLEKSKQVLLEAKEKAKENFGLELRVGIVPLNEIEQKGKSIYVAKYSISKDHSQAIVRGEGLSLAEELLKNEEEKYSIKESLINNNFANFSGLECRWQDIPSPKDETLSLLVKVINKENSSQIYKELISKIEQIAGASTQRHPIKSIDNLNLSFNPMYLNAEASTFSSNIFSKSFVFLKIFVENILGLFLMNKKTSQWADYKNRILRTTDTEKFDDMLRMIISTNKTQTKELLEYFETKFKNKEIIYGVHISNSALMTCLIFERHGKHIHFVDGSNGGYAYASKHMKSKTI
ncbi:MAG: DUF3095 domain-containing protein [Halarcobacter sp.]